MKKNKAHRSFPDTIVITRVLAGTPDEFFAASLTKEEALESRDADEMRIAVYTLAVVLLPKMNDITYTDVENDDGI